VLDVGVFKKEKAAIRKIVNEINQKFSEDTFRNINYFVNAIIEDIAKRVRSL
jgi:histone H3/H4